MARLCVNREKTSVISTLNSSRFDMVSIGLKIDIKRLQVKELMQNHMIAMAIQRTKIDYVGEAVTEAIAMARAVFA